MYLDEIEAFVRVVEAGSFTAAARQLTVPKSTLSRALSRLEDATKTRLLRRSTRSIALTEVGRRFFDQVEPHVAGLRDAVATLSDSEQDPRGLLRITMSVDVAEVLMAEILHRFCQRYPNLQVEVDVSGRFVNLLEEGFDVAIRGAHKLKDSSLVARKILPVELGLFAAPAYLAAHTSPRSVGDLAKHDVVLFHAPGTRADMLGLRESVDMAKVRLVSGDFTFTRAMLVAGAGIGPLPCFHARRHVDEGSLVRVLPDWSRTTGGIYVVYPSAKHTPKKVTLLRDFAQQALSDFSPC